MDSLLLLALMVSLMFAGGHCFSESMSCSFVYGQTICERQKSDGNVAGALSRAAFGQRGIFQDALASAGNTQSIISSVDGHIFRRSEIPNFNFGRMFGPGDLFGSGASDATSFSSNTGNVGISTSGYRGISNNNGIPGPAFGGYAVADSTGNNYYGGNSMHGGGYANGDGGFDPVQSVFQSTGLDNSFPFNIFGRRR